jgi:hypothetical protein
MCVAVDGNVAGPDISPETPLGRDGECLQEWMFAGRTSAESQHFETDHFEGIGALILGRCMADLGIGPPGDEPTFHAPASSSPHLLLNDRQSRAARRTSSSPTGSRTHCCAHRRRRIPRTSQPGRLDGVQRVDTRTLELSAPHSWRGGVLNRR